MIDHLFRHHYGKMVSVLTRIFGLAHLEIIEDAVQDTFIKALSSWRNEIPENPEAWLTKAAKNRTLDIFRKLSAERRRVPKIASSSDALAMQELFLDSEIADSQLRMIFAACHPALKPSDRISFSLKTISGFSSKEIAVALLSKEETVKKRLTRARKVIGDKEISFQIPSGNELPERLDSVLEVLYLIFNEGFYSNRKDLPIRKELCGEALRLCKFLLRNKHTRTENVYALFALMCFHVARMDSRISDADEIIDLKHQDRSLWHFPLIKLGNEAMIKAVEAEQFSCYHYEAAIAAEHLKARTFELTNWNKILTWYRSLYELQPMPTTILNMAVVHMQMEDYGLAYELLCQLQPEDLGQRAYLYYGTLAEYHRRLDQKAQAIVSLNMALDTVVNEAERNYLLKKKSAIY